MPFYFNVRSLQAEKTKIENSVSGGGGGGGAAANLMVFSKHFIFISSLEILFFLKPLSLFHLVFAILLQIILNFSLWHH